MDKKSKQKPIQRSPIQKRRKQKPFIVKLYLFLYNILSFAGWSYVLFILVKSLINSNYDFSTVYQNMRNELTIVQACAIMEIFHSLIGFVPSPVLTTTFQVFSRLLVSYGVLYYVNDKNTNESPILSLMVVAWSVTEIIRYMYYALNIFGKNVKILTWARYTFFFILYPVGASSETFIIYSSILKGTKLCEYYPYIAYSIIALYIPLFPMLYFHMIKQRKRVLGGKKKKTQ